MRQDEARLDEVKIAALGEGIEEETSSTPIQGGLQSAPTELKPQTSKRNLGLVYVAIAVFFFSTSPVLAAWAEPLSPYEKTFGRMLIAALAINALRMLRREPLPTRAALPRFLGYGLVAAAHFLLYIASLSYTTAAHSLAIVYTAPIFVALFSTLFLREPLAGRKWLGIAVAIAGVAVLEGFEPKMQGTMLLGDLLALGAAVAFGLYSVMGRYERDNHSLFSYASAVYGLAAVWLLPGAIFGLVSRPPDFPTGALLAVLALGLFPLALGHTLYNAGLRLAHATYVNVIATQEVTGGIILSAIFLNQQPGGSTIVGALITLVGVVMVIILVGITQFSGANNGSPLQNTFAIRRNHIAPVKIITHH